MTMLNRNVALALALCSVGWTGAAVADEPSAPQAGGPEGLEITMRIIENPDAIAAEAITRRLQLPVPNGENEAPPPVGPADGAEASEAAQEHGKEFGAEVSERARDLADQAADQREDFGRSIAEEMRPDVPEIDPPTPPRP
jgi:hypothetical protein